MTPNPPGRALDGTTGGYLKEVVRDNRTLIRTPAVSTARVQAMTGKEYDNVGNQTRLSDPRGIIHTRVVNERNQVVVSVQAAETSALNPEEPRALAALGYETRTHYDGNDNVKKIEAENVVDQGGGNHQVVSGNPFLETTKVYDLLDDLIEQTEEVANGESRTIRGQSFFVGGNESLTTRYRYDRNQSRVLTLSPLQVAGADANNVNSMIFDERDLLWKSTRGGIDPQWSALVYCPSRNVTVGPPG